MDRRRVTLRCDGLIFDFDGVLLESEYAGNAQIADYLTRCGHPISTEETMARFMGLARGGLTDAIEHWMERPLPPDFDAAREEEDARVLEEGLPAVAGAIAFVEALPPKLPRAVASSSSSRWIAAHLDHLGLRAHFGDMVFSGAEHVERGKPAPDLYLHAARAMGVPIERVVVIEDSPVGVEGALASGAEVIGLCAGSHCLAGHDERLRALGVRHIASGFEEVAAMLGFTAGGRS
jgi:HAD superfamily hydrolase (TIGR01509 family)